MQCRAGSEKQKYFRFIRQSLRRIFHEHDPFTFYVFFVLMPGMAALVVAIAVRIAELAANTVGLSLSGRK